GSMSTFKPTIPDWYREKVLSQRRRLSIRPEHPYRAMATRIPQFCFVWILSWQLILISTLIIQSHFDDALDRVSTTHPKLILAVVLGSYVLPCIPLATSSPYRQLRRLTGRCLNCGEWRVSEFLERCTSCGQDLAEQDGYRRIVNSMVTFERPCTLTLRGLHRSNSSGRRSQIFSFSTAAGMLL